MSKHPIIFAFAGAVLSLSSFNSIASMNLEQSKSSVNFVSTKNEHVSEMHSFERFSGTINDQGKLSITIDISSVNTMIPIRNERLQSMLFSMSEYASASFNAQIDPALMMLKPGMQKQQTIAGEMMIAGNTAPVTFDVMLTGLADGSVNATTTKPTILSTTAFKLDDGVEALKKVAMLQSISKAVPLSFSATFTK